MSTQQSQLVQQNNELKIKCFDLQEALMAERQNIGQFCNQLAQLLELEGEQAQDLQNYINAIVELKGLDKPTDETEK